MNLRELIESRDFMDMKAPLPCVLGRDIIGRPFFADLAGMPHVVAYRTHPVTYLAARSLVRVPWIGLSSLVADRLVSPEFIQRRASPAALARAVGPLLDADGDAAAAQRRAFADVRSRLGTPGASRRVAELVMELAA